MSDTQISGNDFLEKITKSIEENLSNPQFGVSMLAKEMGMSRSNLHRKVNKITKITVSQFICHVRLKKAKEILRHTAKTVSEVAYEVGFNNVSYFIKCFHKYYGYSPGKIGNREEENNLNQPVLSIKKMILPTVSIFIIVVVLILVFKPFSFQPKKLEKVIAILPTENWENSDSILIFSIFQIVKDNLREIEDVSRIVPQQSVLKYKNSIKSAPEIAKELKANYLIKSKVWPAEVKEKFLLSITLIEGVINKELETFNYVIDSTNLPTVSLDLTKDIIGEFDIAMSNEEQATMYKSTNSKTKARNHYWKGVTTFNSATTEFKARNNEEGFKKLDLAKNYFKLALENDGALINSYSYLASTYMGLSHYTSNFEYKKMYLDSSLLIYEKLISIENTDKDILKDAYHSAGLIAARLRLDNKADNYFLEYDKIINLSGKERLLFWASRYSIYHDYYNSIKYSLEYMNAKPTLQSLQATNRLLYNNLSRAGFHLLADTYSKKLLKYNNDTASYLCRQYFTERELNNYDAALIHAEKLYKIDSTNTTWLTLLMDINVWKRNYKEAYKYLEKWNLYSEEKIPYGFIGDYCTMGFIYLKNGRQKEADIYFDKGIDDYLKQEESGPVILSDTYTNLAIIYFLKGNEKESLKYFNLVNHHHTVSNSIIQTFKTSPYSIIIQNPDFERILIEMEKKYEKEHKRIAELLDKYGYSAN